MLSYCFSDVKFALIGFGAPEQKWPSIYTVNGKYNEFTGTAKNIYFVKEPEVEEHKLSDKLKEIWKRLAIETGMFYLPPHIKSS